MVASLAKPCSSFEKLTADVLQSGSLIQGAISKEIYLSHPALKNTLLSLDNSHQTELNAGEEMTVRSHSESINE